MEIFIATGNQHKVDEFKQMLEPHGYIVKSLKDLDANIDIEENGSTFEENALIKAKFVAEKYNIIAISDDSGLEVDALNKQPGIYSARFLGKDTDYKIKNQYIIDHVAGKTRLCRFVCAIAICYPNGKHEIFRGTIEGEVANEITGEHGFGYDPIFYYEPFNTTLANVSADKKNSVSHRHNALVKLLEYLNDQKD